MSRMWAAKGGVKIIDKPFLETQEECAKGPDNPQLLTR